LRRINPSLRIVIINIQAVPIIDMTAMMALNNVIADCHKQGIGIIFVGAEHRVLRKMQRAGLDVQKGKLEYTRDFSEAKEYALRWLDDQESNKAKPA